MKSLLSPKFTLTTLLIASIYIVLITYLMNGQLVLNTIFGNFSFEYRIGLLLALLQGMWTSMSGIGLITLFAIAFLTGANLTLFLSRLNDLKKAGSLKLSVGGGTFLGIISSGCAACGLPILALLGLGSSVAYLPLRGVELSYLAIFLLVASLYLLNKSLNSAKACKLNINYDN